MATNSLDPEPREHQRRRLPKLIPPEPVGVSSDETPRPGTGDASARQRRRTQQRIVRERTPDSTEILSPIPKRESTLPPRAEDSDERKAAKRRKARRRVQSSSQLSPEPSILQGFEDEIIVESRKKATSTLPDLLLSSNFAGTVPSKSALTPRVYFENKKSFSSVNKETAAARLADASNSSPFSLAYNQNFTIKQQTADTLKRFTVQVAKQTHAGLQRFFMFIHGINAGYALWMCIFVYVFSQGSNQSFFETYRSIALITHILFYLFLAFCMVDILDRVDPVKFDRSAFFESISVQNSAIAIFFYAVAMTVNLVMIRTEDGLRMISFTANNTNQTAQFLNDVINSSGDQWKQLTAVRAAFCVAGWFIVSMHVNKDRLRTMIKNTEDNAFYQELNIEENAVPLDGRLNSA